jgi:hypothetical protein
MSAAHLDVLVPSIDHDRRLPELSFERPRDVESTVHSTATAPSRRFRASLKATDRRPGRGGVPCLATRGGEHRDHYTPMRDMNLLSRWIRCRIEVFAGIAITLMLWPSSASAQTHLVSESEARDGEIHDMASQFDATSSADQKRAWVAQGRVRAALRLSDRARMAAEDKTFSQLDPNIKEWVLRVELDDPHGYLYTLTADGVLYRESIKSPYSPSSPGGSTFLKLKNGSLVPALDAAESVQDIKLIPGDYGDNYVLVLTNYRPIVVRSNAQGLSLLPPAQGFINGGQSLDLFDRMTNPGESHPYLYTGGADPSFDALHVQQLRSVTVSLDATGKPIAYMLAGFTKYESSGRLGVVHPYCQILLLCNLDSAHTFASPTFDTEPGGIVRYAYWNPYANYTGAGNDVTALQQHNIYDVAAGAISGITQVIAACGSQKQLHRLLANFATGGVTDVETLNFDATQDLFKVQSDPNHPTRFYVHGSFRFFVYDLTQGMLGMINQDPFFLGGLGDSSMILLPKPSGGTRTTVWFVGAGSIDHTVKGYDVTAPTAPSRVGEIGFLWRTDGAVALDFNNVYIPSWGGVRQYVRSSGDWTFAGYQAAQIMELGVKKQFNTEQIAIGTLSSGDDRLFVAANTLDSGINRNGILEFKLNSSHAPGPASFIEVQPSWLGWTAVGFNMYSNDVAFLNFAGQSFLFIDVTHFGGGQPNETALVAFRWDSPSGAWVFSGAAKTVVGVGLSTTITVSTAGGVPVAFVSGDFGIVSYDLSGIVASSPWIQARTFIDYFAQNGKGSWGMVAARSRIIVFYDHWSGNPNFEPEIVIYDWTTWGALAGTINPSAVKRIDATSIVPSWVQSYRGRYDPIDTNSGYVYNCNDAAVYRLFYDASTAQVSYDASWKSDYSGATQDCRIYSFGSTKRALVAKDVESFAWVDL